MKNQTPLRTALRSRGISMRDAARAGIPYATIVAHCLGLRNMSLNTAKRYAQKLGIPLEEIIGLPVAASPQKNSSAKPGESLGEA